MNYALPWGGIDNVKTTRVYFKNQTITSFIPIRIDSDLISYTLTGLENSDISNLIQGETYEVFIRTTYNNDQTFDTPTFDFSASFDYSFSITYSSNSNANTIDDFKPSGSSVINNMYMFKADTGVINAHSVYKLETSGLKDLHYANVYCVVGGAGGSGGKKESYGINQPQGYSNNKHNTSGGHGGWLENSHFYVSNDLSYHVYVASKSSGHIQPITNFLNTGISYLTDSDLSFDLIEHDVLGINGLYSSIQSDNIIIKADGGNGSFGTRNVIVGDTSDVSIRTYNHIYSEDISYAIGYVKPNAKTRSYGRGGDVYIATITNNGANGRPGEDGIDLSFNGIDISYGGGGGSGAYEWYWSGGSFNNGKKSGTIGGQGGRGGGGNGMKFHKNNNDSTIDNASINGTPNTGGGSGGGSRYGHYTSVNYNDTFEGYGGSGVVYLWGNFNIP